MLNLKSFERFEKEIFSFIFYKVTTYSLYKYLEF